MDNILVKMKKKFARMEKVEKMEKIHVIVEKNIVTIRGLPSVGRGPISGCRPSSSPRPLAADTERPGPVGPLTANDSDKTTAHSQGTGARAMTRSMTRHGFHRLQAKWRVCVGASGRPPARALPWARARPPYPARASP